MGSIVLNPGVKEMLLNDTKDFLKSEKVGTSPPHLHKLLILVFDTVVCR